MNRFIKVISVIAVIIIIFATGIGIRRKQLQSQIDALQQEYDKAVQTVESMQASIDLADKQWTDDKQFLDIMFDEIFTFYDLKDFENARLSALNYNLPDYFIETFYDKEELTRSYSEMLDIICKYDSADLYLLERKDNTAYYAAIVTLDMVKYNEKFRIVLFIALDNTGDISERVHSMYYYNTK